MTADGRPQTAVKTLQLSGIGRRSPELCSGAVGRLIILALLLRIAFLFLAGVNAPLVGDELAYQQIAENLAAGRGFFQTNNPFFPGQTLYAWQAPLYPLSLGVLYASFGANPLVGKLFGIVVSVATVYIVYDLARRVFHRSSTQERIPWLAALLVAIYPGFLTHAHLLLSETLFTFLLVLAFDLLAIAASPVDNGRLNGVVISLLVGVVWGAATLTRGITMYFAPVLALWIVFASASARRGMVSALAFLIATATIIAPWTLRNYHLFDRVVLLETKGGVNLWLGNSPFTPNDFIRNVWKVGVREPMLAALPSGEVERDQAGYALALAYIAREPLTFLARMPIKFADLYGFERNLVDVADATHRGQSGGWNSPGKIAADVYSALAYIALMLTGILGFVTAPADRWKWLLGVFILYFTVVHLAVFGDGRFHLPLIPFFALYAAWFGVHRVRVKWRSAHRAAAAALVLVFVLVWLREIVAAIEVFSTRN